MLGKISYSNRNRSKIVCKPKERRIECMRMTKQMKSVNRLRVESSYRFDGAAPDMRRAEQNCSVRSLRSTAANKFVRADDLRVTEPEQLRL